MRWSNRSGATQAGWEVLVVWAVAVAMVAAAALGAQYAVRSAERLARNATERFIVASLRTSELALTQCLEARSSEARLRAASAQMAETARFVMEEHSRWADAERFAAEAVLDELWTEGPEPWSDASWLLVDDQGRALLGAAESMGARAGILLNRVSADPLRRSLARSLLLSPVDAARSGVDAVSSGSSLAALAYVVAPVPVAQGEAPLFQLVELELPADWLTGLARAVEPGAIGVFDRFARPLCPQRTGDGNSNAVACLVSDEEAQRMARAINQSSMIVDVGGYEGRLGNRVVGGFLWQPGASFGVAVSFDERQMLAPTATFASGTWAAFWVCASVLLGAAVLIANGTRRALRTIRETRLSLERLVSARTADLEQTIEQLSQKLAQHQLSEVRLLNAQRGLEESSERLARLSQTDALTNLPNRRRFDEFLEQQWRRAMGQRVCIALLLVDVDYFKLFNDTYGHAAGDDCLRAVARILANSIRRPDDLIARLGGEAFAVLLCDADIEVAKATAQHIRDAVEALAIDHEATLVRDADTVTVSIGYSALVPDEGTGASVLLYNADEALFLAKQDGRACSRACEGYLGAVKSSSHLRPIVPTLWPSEVVSRKRS